MANGAEIKIGIDATDVKKGLKETEKGFANLSKNIGGKMKTVGIGLAGIAAGAIAMANAAGDAFNTLAAYTGDLEDMRAQTGLSITTLMEWTRAFELAGVPISDASKMVSKFQDSMEDAKKGATPFRDALNEIGFIMPDLEGLGTEDQLRIVGQRISEMAANGESMASLSSTMQDLMGVKMGPGLLRLFKDDSVFEKAKTDVAELASELEKNAAFLGEIQDETSRTFYDRKLAQMQAVPLARESFGNDGVAIGAGIRDIEQKTTIAAESAAIKTALKVGGLLNPSNYSTEGLTSKNILNSITDTLGITNSAEDLKQTQKAQLDALRSIEKNTKQQPTSRLSP